MNDNLEMRERERLKGLAREYKSLGYNVIIHPESSQLPDFLQGLEIDLLAENSEEHVIVEVRSQKSMTNPPRLERLAHALQGRSGWRFDLVVTHVRDEGIASEEAPIDVRTIVARLREAAKLWQDESPEAAYLLAWTATEGVLRSLTTSKRTVVIQTPVLLKSLVIDGVIDREQYRALLDGWEARNTLIHGFAAPQFAKNTEQFQRLLATAEQLLHQITTPLDVQAQ